MKVLSRFKIMQLCVLLLFTSCPQDGLREANYSRVKPLLFDVTVVNNTDHDAKVIFGRTQAEIEEFDAPRGQTTVKNGIVCIDSRWKDSFRGLPGGMQGFSKISLSVAGQKEEIGEYCISCCGTAKTYGYFISGKFYGKRSGTYPLKLTIQPDGSLDLEYPEGL